MKGISVICFVEKEYMSEVRSIRHFMSSYWAQADADYSVDLFNDHREVEVAQGNPEPELGIGIGVAVPEIVDARIPMPQPVGFVNEDTGITMFDRIEAGVGNMLLEEANRLEVAAQTQAHAIPGLDERPLERTWTAGTVALNGEVTAATTVARTFVVHRPRFRHGIETTEVATRDLWAFINLEEWSSLTEAEYLRQCTVLSSVWVEHQGGIAPTTTANVSHSLGIKKPRSGGSFNITHRYVFF